MGAALVQSKNVDLGGGAMRMPVDHIRSEHGGLASVVHDSTFVLESGNPSYLFTDMSSLYQASNKA